MLYCFKNFAAAAVKKAGDRRGFTLTELLATAAIIGIIAAISVPFILGMPEKARRAADTANERNMAVAFLQKKKLAAIEGEKLDSAKDYYYDAASGEIVSGTYKSTPDGYKFIKLNADGSDGGEIVPYGQCLETGAGANGHNGGVIRIKAAGTSGSEYWDWKWVKPGTTGVVNEANFSCTTSSGIGGIVPSLGNV